MPRTHDPERLYTSAGFPSLVGRRTPRRKRHLDDEAPVTRTGLSVAAHQTRTFLHSDEPHASAGAGQVRVRPIRRTPVPRPHTVTQRIRHDDVHARSRARFHIDRHIRTVLVLDRIRE